MKFSTSTITTDGLIVPWLAADGPLAYSPFSPPMDDYFFLYNFILPGIFAQDVNVRRHYWFGDFGSKDDFDIIFLRSFWEEARCGYVQPIYINEPSHDLLDFEAPIAIFKYTSKHLRRSYYLFIQHGSYLEIPVSEQPLIEDGFVQIYRGIGNAKEFNVHQMPRDEHVIGKYRSICAGESEVKILSLDKLIPIKAIRCKFKSENIIQD